MSIPGPDRSAGTLPVARVINLAASTGRMAAIAARLDAAGIPWVRHDATAPASTEAAHRHPLYRSARVRALFGRDLGRGEVGAYLSHLAVTRAALDEGAALAVILEDDADPAPGAAAVLRDLAAWMTGPQARPVHWLHLSHTIGKWGAPLADVGGCRVLRAWRPPLISSAILWTRAGIETFLAFANREGIDRPADDAMRACFARAGTGAVLARPIFAEDGSESTIDPQNSRQAPSSKLIRMRRKVPDYYWASLHRLRGT